MKKTLLSSIWGILLILGGGLFLAVNLGYIDEFSNSEWVWIIAGLSVLFFGTYVLTGLQRWGYLIPACVLGGTAVTIALGEAGVTSSAVGAPVLIGVGLPFLVAFGINPRKHWWALIPAFMMGMVTMLLFIADIASGEAIGSALLYSFALPFVVAYLTNTQNRKWALIPAYVFIVVGTIPWVSTRVSGEWIGAMVMYAIALPFWVTFLTNSQRWWAVIPAGILTSIGITVWLIGAWSFSDHGLAVLSGGMNLGIAATFFLVWLRRGTQPVEWAKIPAIAFLVFGLLTFTFGVDFDLFWPVLLIAAGIMVVYFNLRPKHA